MASKVRQLREVISRELYESARLDIIKYVVTNLIAQMPKAQFIEISLCEFYDDDSSTERHSNACRCGDCLARESHPEWKACKQ